MGKSEPWKKGKGFPGRGAVWEGEGQGVCVLEVREKMTCFKKQKQGGLVDAAAKG